MSRTISAKVLVETETQSIMRSTVTTGRAAAAAAGRGEEVFQPQKTSSPQEKRKSYTRPAPPPPLLIAHDQSKPSLQRQHSNCSLPEISVHVPVKPRPVSGILLLYYTTIITSFISFIDHF